MVLTFLYFSKGHARRLFDPESIGFDAAMRPLPSHVLRLIFLSQYIVGSPAGRVRKRL